MIHHISIPAKNPAHIASVIAELFNTNYCAPFPSHEGSYVALAGDEYGTVLVYRLLLESLKYPKDKLQLQF
ncbi:MAG: hypothetical protein AAFX46_19880, partial [Cyanobacteria bacterium J06636_27]